MQLTLLVPELLWPEPENTACSARLVARGLCTLLARGTLSRHPQTHIEAALAATFSHPEHTAYAAFRRMGENSPPLQTDGYWLCCDPVHLHFQKDRLIPADNRILDLSPDDAQALAATLRSQIPALSGLEVVHPGRWYLRLPDETRLDARACLEEAPPLSAVCGRGLRTLLPETTAARPLRHLLNEVQMLLHDHPVNRQREANGRKPVNSLWLWGAGKRPQCQACAFNGLWSGQPLALGLARAAGIAAAALPADASALLARATPGSHNLVVFEEAQPASAQGDTAHGSRKRTLQALEHNWFAPLFAALARNRISRLCINAPGDDGTLQWSISPAQCWKFWQRPQPLARFLQQKPETDGPG